MAAKQGSLFGPPSMPEVQFKKPPSNGTATSDAAAESIKGHVSGRQRKAILAVVNGAGERGLTDEEIADRLVPDIVSANALRARRGELAEKGLIKDSGKTRPTRSGREARVWQIAK